MASIPQRELERFFAEVGPRLETAQTLDDELDRQLARRFNVFRYLRTDEMGFSRIIADLLDPSGDHGQGAAFLKLLTAKLDFASGVDLSDAKVQTERQIDGRRRIDIVVEIDSKHCLAIENKSNFADDQERQVADDLAWLEKYDHSVLVYLSPTGDGPLEKSVDRETIKRLGTTKPKTFVIMPCHSKRTPSDDFDNLRLPLSLVDWLSECRRICDVDRLRWYLREAETYCQRRYGGTFVTDSKKNAIGDFLRKDATNLTTAMAVYEAWPEVVVKIKKDFLDLIWRGLPKDMERYRNYGKKRYESYIYIYRKTWRPFTVDGEERLTTIYMRAEARDGTNWDIGVFMPAVSRVSEGDRERCQKLHAEISALSKSHGKNQNDSWPWWERVEDKYRYWDSLIPRCTKRCRQERAKSLAISCGSSRKSTARRRPQSTASAEAESGFRPPRSVG